MPLHFTIDESAELMLTTGEGTVTMDDLLSHARALVGRPGRPRLELADFSAAEFVPVPLPAIREMATFLRANDVNAEGARLALVAVSDEVLEALRLYAKYRAHDSVAIEVFRDRDEALRWLTARDEA